VKRGKPTGKDGSKMVLEFVHPSNLLPPISFPFSLSSRVELILSLSFLSFVQIGASEWVLKGGDEEKLDSSSTSASGALQVQLEVVEGLP